MKRLISTIIGIPIVIILLNWHPPYGSAFLFLTIGLFGYYENYLINLKHHRSILNYTIVFLFITIGLLCGHLLNIRSLELKIPWIYLALGLTWGNDGSAMILGKLFGKIKLAPSISPNKTVEGAVAGIVTASIVYTLFLYKFLGETTAKDLVANFMTGILLSILAIIGDLYLSSCKRASGLKDSGFLIPGHGGVLDKIDAMSVLFMSIYLLISWT